MRIKSFRKKGVQTATYHQVATYLTQKKVPAPLVNVCVWFLEDRARDVGETYVGSKTIMNLLHQSWQLSECELEAFYHKAPSAMSQYVSHMTCDPAMPSWQELVRPVEMLSAESQQAYIFLSEMALRVAYGMLYEPATVWRVVRLYDSEPRTATVG